MAGLFGFAVLASVWAFSVVAVFLPKQRDFSWLCGCRNAAWLWIGLGGGKSVPKERELAASQQKDCQAEQAKSQKGTGGERARQDKKRG